MGIYGISQLLLWEYMGYMGIIHGYMGMLISKYSGSKFSRILQMADRDVTTHDASLSN